MAAVNFSKEGGGGKGDKWERESKEGGQRSWHQQLWSDSSAEEVRHFPNRLSEDNRAATGQEGRATQGGGCLVTDGQLRMNLSIHGCSSHPHRLVIYLHPPYLPWVAFSHLSIHLSSHHSDRLYLIRFRYMHIYMPSPWGKSALIKLKIEDLSHKYRLPDELVSCIFS